MISVYSIIINSFSGKGKALKALPGLENLLTQKGIGYRIDKTKDDFGVTRLAEKAVQDGLDGIIIAGGDGTFSLAANGIGESGLEVIFAPCGTGNDFMRMFRLPKDPIAAVKKQLESPVRMVDMGKINDGYFLNVAGCGFDVDVLLEVEKLKGKFSAVGAYLRGAYSSIKNYRPLTAEISVDGGEAQKFDGTVIAIGNGRYFGGGMKAVPSAIVDDGKFDLVCIEKVNKISIYYLLLLFSAGYHPLLKKLVKTVRCSSVRITKKALDYEADGEIYSADEINLKILPGALRTRLPG